MKRRKRNPASMETAQRWLEDYKRLGSFPKAAAANGVTMGKLYLTLRRRGLIEKTKEIKIPDAQSRAMYADYLRLSSLSKTAKLWGRSRQAMWEILRSRFKLNARVKRLHEPVIYKGRKFTPSKNGYLRLTQRSGAKETQLHRVVWMDHHGEIPTGHQVMFRNGDKQDCDLLNLACLPISEVSRLTASGENQFTKGRAARLAASMERFIAGEASRYSRLIGGSACDLEQAGRIQALKSSKAFKDDGGASFYTYSYRCIRRAIRIEAQRTSRQITMPDARFFDSGISTHSLNAPLAEDDPDGGTYGDRIAGDEDVGRSVEDAERAAILLKVISKLPAREREIMQLRFYENKTYREIAELKDLSHQRIRQIEMEVLSKLRRSRNLKRLEVAA